MPVPLLSSPVLAALPGIRHGFTTRAGGVSGGAFAGLNIQPAGGGDDPAAVAENMARAVAALAIPSGQLALPRQVHGIAVATAAGPTDMAARPEADAIVTTRPGLAVGVITADCAGILLADAEAGIVAAAHAGWRGALGGVCEAALAAMEGLGARRERIAAAIGPAIRQANYETGPELVAEFAAADAAYARFFRPSARPGHALFDLAGLIAHRLERAGVRRVDDLGLCTYADEARFYSHRRATHRGEPATGRHMAMIAIA